MFCNHTKICGNVKHFYYNWSDLQRLSQHGFCYLLPCSPCTFSSAYRSTHLCFFVRLDCQTVLHTSDKILLLLHGTAHFPFPFGFSETLCQAYYLVSSSQHFIKDNYIQGALVNYYHSSLHACMCISSFPN